MGLDDLKPAPGSRKPKKRIGRGVGSGHGKTATRGNKGQLSRAGGHPRRGFEGGQMPLHRRLPKKGFKNHFRKDIVSVNVRELNRFEDGTEITPEMMVQIGIIGRIGDGVKILAYGDLKRKLAVSAHFFSAAAAQKIEAAGGSVRKL